MLEEFPEVYLGDEVFAAFDGDRMWLHAQSAPGKWHRIALEPHVFKALMEYGQCVFGGSELHGDVEASNGERGRGADGTPG